MTKFNSVTTSGNGMHINENGGNRDSAEGKLDYTLLPIPALNRVVQHYINGLKKYGRNNWHKLNTPADIERYKQSMFRHLIQYLERKKDEDHLAAVVWNALALLFFEETKQGEYVETKKKAINPGNNTHQVFSDLDINTDKLRKIIEKMRREILIKRENTIATIHGANLLVVNSRQHIKSTLTITVDISGGENLLQVEKLLNSLSNNKSSIKAEITFIKE